MRNDLEIHIAMHTLAEIQALYYARNEAVLAMFGVDRETACLLSKGSLSTDIISAIHSYVSATEKNPFFSENIQEFKEYLITHIEKILLLEDCISNGISMNLASELFGIPLKNLRARFDCQFEPAGAKILNESAIFNIEDMVFEHLGDGWSFTICRYEYARFLLKTALRLGVSIHQITRTMASQGYEFSFTIKHINQYGDK
ncbi:MAG: hypothetical protein LRY75_16605 [Shewanella xiamenensis]|uniref:Uncharacterized protein n=2 Tax=Shewanella TaxID=22 RepID=A0AAE4Q5Y1_9GAMM|nr:MULTISPECIES: hypothetical protein [Shewanella]MCD8552105.1 hypothetical protein [Shewanella xiamenensis]MCD8560394.1 hypothetical protein [Shewanella xiamenensis]MCK7657653.1 hypothetical protein [Shewanella sp. JNE4-2]MCT8858158.1 hypothetical protein [Shewanella xiamenensis]MDH0451104.1 hypothetical protein [Shewanella sp. GD04112]